MEYPKKKKKSYHVSDTAYNVLRIVELIGPGLASLTIAGHQWTRRPVGLELDWPAVVGLVLRVQLQLGLGGDHPGEQVEREFQQVEC